MNPSTMTKARWLEQFLSPEKIHSLHQTTEICRALIQKSGVHSVIDMKTAGFRYTDNGDTARCDGCSLEVSGRTLDMKPFDIHAQRSLQCPHVLSVLPDKIIPVPVTISFIPSSVDDVSFRHQKIESIQQNTQPNILVEIKKIKEIRRRTFSHWPHRTSPSSAQMIESGFFSCNGGDRVICLYCNLICQQWVPNTDDPWEVHKILSPQCPYVIAMVKYRQEASVSIINEYSPNDHSLASNKCVKRYNRKEISHLVRDRLDLPITKSLVAEGFDLLIIKSCYEKQLRLMHDDFVDDCDLRMACTILQKQIKHIDGKQENIIIPSVAINKIRGRELSGISNNLSSNADVEILTSPQDSRSEMNVQDQHNEPIAAF